MAGQRTAVSAVPDQRKGERLIMVTDKHGATRAISWLMREASTPPN